MLKSRKTEIIIIRVTEDQKKKIKEKAQQSQKTISAYILNKVN